MGQQLKGPAHAIRVGMVLVAALLTGLFGCQAEALIEKPPATEQAPQPVVVVPTPTPHPPPVFTGTLKPRQTLSHLLTELDAVSEHTAREITQALSKKLDLRKLRPGNTYRLELDGAAQFKLFRYTVSPELIVTVVPTDQGLEARKEPVSLEIRPHVVEGTIQSTLVEAVLEKGEDIGFAMGLLEAYQWDINFYTDTRKGDTFKALVEKVYVDGEPLRIGRVLMAIYEGSFTGRKEAYFYHGDHFDAKGIYLQKSWLTTPLNTLRITSRFGQRFHPVLKRRRMHKGLDYGAPSGTPVWAVANGTVAVAGNRGDGYGKQVLLRHQGGYSSRYAHLSRVNVRRGQKIKQKKMIGRVGKTGLATGAHLHFEILVNGKQVNPQRVRMLPTIKRKVKDMAAFQTERKRLDALFEGIEVATAELPTDGRVQIY